MATAAIQTPARPLVVKLASGLFALDAANFLVDSAMASWDLREYRDSVGLGFVICPLIRGLPWAAQAWFIALGLWAGKSWAWWCGFVHESILLIALALTVLGFTTWAEEAIDSSWFLLNTAISIAAVALLALPNTRITYGATPGRPPGMRRGLLYMSASMLAVAIADAVIVKLLLN